MVETLGVEPSFHRRYHFRALSEVIPMLAAGPGVEPGALESNSKVFTITLTGYM